MRIDTKGLRLGSALALAALGLAQAAPAAAAVKRVTFVLSSNEPRYTETKDAILDVVSKAGMSGAIETSLVVLEKDKSKAPETMKSLASKTDVFITMGTVATMAAAKTIKNKPVVFGHVFNPVDAGIVKDWESSGNNFTGGSNYVPLSRFMLRLNEVMPLKRVGVLFTPGEKQAELHLAEYQKGAKTINVQVSVIDFKDAKDADGLEGKLKGLDALFLTGGTPIGKNLTKVMKAAIAAKVPTATHTDSFIFADPGALLGVTCTAEEVGKIAGDALVKVLKGVPPSSIPSRYPVPQMVLNGKTAQAEGFTPTPGLKQWITKTIN